MVTSSAGSSGASDTQPLSEGTTASMLFHSSSMDSADDSVASTAAGAPASDAAMSSSKTNSPSLKRRSSKTTSPASSARGAWAASLLTISPSASQTLPDP